MSINIPHAKREVFKQHIIRRCILRIDYSDLFDVSDFTKSLINVLTDKYPVRKREKEGLLLFPQDITENSEEKKEDNKFLVNSFIFSDKDGLNFIKINNHFISYEFNSYVNFDDALSVFNVVFNEFKKYFPRTIITRLGLRKINVYEQEEEKSLQSFREYFNPFYTSHLTDGLFDKDLIIDQHIMTSSDNNGLNINLKYATQPGILNDRKYRRFILDIDCFTGDVNEDNVNERLKVVNDRIFDIFSWSITDKLKEELRK